MDLGYFEEEKQMINKRIRYCDNKRVNEVVSNVFIKGTEKYCEELGATLKTNEYRAFIKDDPIERAWKQIERNDRKMRRLYARIVKPEGFVEKAERLNKISLKSPEEAKPNG